MSKERRYTEQEIASIFKQASEDQQAAAHLAAHEGLTLSEMEAIGRDAGIRPEFIARAAAAMNKKVAAPAPDKALGLPVSVSRIVDVAGEFTDASWQQLVTDLHDVFGVTGRVSQNGAMRIWEHDRMEVTVEPSGNGYRIRMRSMHDLYMSGLYGGLMLLVMGLFFLLVVASKGDLLTAKGIFVSMFSVVGTGAMGLSATRLRHWRKTQEKNMDTIVSRLGTGATDKSETPEQAEAFETEGERIRLDAGEGAGGMEDEASSAHRIRSRT